MSAPTATIVFLKTASTFSTPGRMPTSSDLNLAGQTLGAAGMGIKVLIIDTELTYVLRRLTGKIAPVESDQSEEEKGILNLKNIEVDFREASTYPAFVSMFDDQPRHVKEIPRASKDPIIFISHNPQHVSSYDVMSEIEDYTSENRTFLLSPKMSLAEIVATYVDVIKGGTDKNKKIFTSTYTPFTGAAIANVSNADHIASFKMMFHASRICVEWIRAGYDVEENKDNVPGWTLNPETPIIKGIRYVYGLQTSVPDVSPLLDIRQNSGYRAQLCEAIKRVLSNFAINNGILKAKDVPTLGGWSNIKTYEFIRDKMDATLKARR